MAFSIMNDGRGDFKLDAAREYAPVVKGAAPLPDGVCRGLLVDVAGTANLTTLNGRQRDNVPLQAGYNLLACTHVRAGGTADGIWALY